MYVSKLKIENFRGIAELELKLDPSNVLIGENNAGKTSVLAALDAVLGRQAGRGPRLHDYDHHRKDADRDLPDKHRVAITATIEETEDKPWPIEFTQALADVVQLTDDARYVIIQVRSTYDADARDFQPEAAFLSLEGTDLPKSPERLLKRFIPAFYLPTERSASSDFRRGARFWAPFLRDPEVDPDTRKDLENRLHTLSSDVLSAAPNLSTLRNTLDGTGRLIALPSEHPVNLEPLPARLPEVLERTEVRLDTPTGASVPLDRYGGGTQNVAVLFLFQAYLATTLASEYEPQTSPILAIEEPEAHLHPSAARSAWNVIQGMHGQKVVATHSGDLLASAPLSAIRRLTKTDDKVTVNRVKPTTLSAEDERKVDFHIRRSRGELLFGNVWLLGEGECEYWIFAGAAEAMDIDLEGEGVRVVDSFSQTGLTPLIKVADDLGIQWHCVADGDQQGRATVNRLKALLKGRPETDHITLLSYSSIEHLLCSEGFSDTYEATLRQSTREGLPAHDAPEYAKTLAKKVPKKRKVSAAVEIADLLRTGSRVVPPSVADVLQSTLKLVP